MVHPHICTDLANFYSNWKVNGFVCSDSMLINQVNQQDTAHVTYYRTMPEEIYLLLPAVRNCWYPVPYTEQLLWSSAWEGYNLDGPVAKLSCNNHNAKPPWYLWCHMSKLVVQFSITGTHDDQSPYIQLHCTCNIEYTWVYEQIWTFCTKSLWTSQLCYF